MALGIGMSVFGYVFESAGQTFRPSFFFPVQLVHTLLLFLQLHHQQVKFPLI